MPGAVLYWLLVCVATIGLMRPVLAEEATTPAARGEALVTANCARCHAVGRTGASAHPDAPPFRTLSRKYKIEGLAEALAEGLSTGHPDMPEFVFAPRKWAQSSTISNPFSSSNGCFAGIWLDLDRDPIVDPSQNSASSIVRYVARGTAAGGSEAEQRS
jgi:cbb3-type cytochrome c oxidase subunit III